MANCLIYGNQADWSSGGIQLSASEVGNNNTTNATLINCTISDNWLNDVGPGAGIYVLAHEGNGAEVVADIYNTIVYDNTLPGDIAEDLTINMDAPGTVTVNTKFCNIGNIDDLILDDGWGPPIFNTTNVSGEDPDFVDPASGDYHLIATSPCIDDGTALVPDPPGLPVTDIDGNLRVIGTRPDIGAYEYTGAGPGITWNCPLGGVTFIAPYPIHGRPYLTVAVDPAEITASAGAALWGIYYLDETTGEWLYFIPGFASNTLTQLEPDEFYLVVVSDACMLTLPQGT
jgi:hypothetical protein